MAWHQIGDKPLSETMLTQFTDAYMQALGRDVGSAARKQTARKISCKKDHLIVPCDCWYSSHDYVTNWTEFVKWDSLVPGTGQRQATVMPTVTCLMRVHVCVPCEWWSGPGMCDGSLLNLCYLCQLWYMKPRDLSTATHQWCLQCLPQLCAVT